MSFDLAAHQRARLRTLEDEVRYLRSHRDRLERLLGYAVTVATAGTETTPLALLAALEDVDARASASVDVAALVEALR